MFLLAAIILCLYGSLFIGSLVGILYLSCKLKSSLAHFVITVLIFLFHAFLILPVFYTDETIEASEAILLGILFILFVILPNLIKDVIYRIKKTQASSDTSTLKNDIKNE